MFFNFLIVQFIFNPLPCVHKCLKPRSAVVVAAGAWIPGVLPWEDGTLKVWHHCEMTTVGAADSCHVIVRTVGVAWIFSVVVLCNDIVVVLRLWHIEASLAVGHPDTQFAAAESTEHHAVVAWDV